MNDVALAAALDRSEQIVEVGAVVPVLKLPVERLVLDRRRAAARLSRMSSNGETLTLALIWWNCSGSSKWM